jgi:glycolate oxidase FAD binding subunit
MAVMAAAAANAVREQIAEARERGETIRIAGRRQWLDAAHPVSAARTLDLAGLTGIVEYVPGDFTLTALAGTPLGDIQRATSAENQWLALDPFGSDRGSLGATVATASAGPLAHAFGTARDQVLGIEAVTGTGDLIRAGGRVVKNVAGFDLTRLFTGSWGTLGAITEISVRLRAVPVAEAHLAVELPDDQPAAIAALCRDACRVRAEPYALELIQARFAARLGLSAATTLLVRLGGNATAVASQRAAVATLGRVTDTDAGVWESMRTAEPAGCAVVRISSRPSALPSQWTAMLEAMEALPDALIHATVARGTVRAIVPDAPPAALAGAVQRLARHARGFSAERLPPVVWAIADAARAERAMSSEMAASERVRDELLRRVKDTFDPMHLLNPGIMGEAIA